MSNPTVVCICLTRDRPEMLKRAVASFRAQRYENKRLLVFNTGTIVGVHDLPLIAELGVGYKGDRRTIGALRNEANSLSRKDEIIAHFDDDDWSHPNRLTEQVALLEASGAECVGYNSMLFWDMRIEGGVAYLYCAHNPTHCCGTSMLYWRSAWERIPFDDIMTGEDTRWQRKHHVMGVSSLSLPRPCDPRMIASVHGANTSGYAPDKDRTSSRRVPAWDQYCERTMRL